MKKAICILLSVAYLFTGCNSSKEVSVKGDIDIEKSVEENKKEIILETATIEIMKGLTKEEKEELFKLEEGYNRPIRVVYNGGICGAVPVIADYLGYFEDEGLKADIFVADDAKEALGTKKADISTNHIAAWAVPAVNGFDMKFVSGINTGCQSLYVLADSPYQTIEDLKGMNISVPNGIGNSSHNITLRFLGADNLDPQDFNFVHIEQGAVILAMQKGEIVAATMGDQYGKQFVLDGTLRVIRSITYDDDFTEDVCCITAINGTFLKKNPITAEKLSRIFQRANMWYEENKPEAVQFLLENGHVSGNYDYALILAEELNFNISEKATELTLRDVIKDYQKFGLMPANKNPEDILNSIWTPFGLDDERDEWNITKIKQ